MTSVNHNITRPLPLIIWPPKMGWYVIKLFLTLSLFYSINFYCIIYCFIYFFFKLWSLSTEASYHLFFFLRKYMYLWASLVAQRVKNPPAMQDTWVRSLGREDPLEKGMATHFSFLTWRMPWTEEPSRLQSMGLQKVRHDLVAKHAGICICSYN